jgi:outer membrane lipoprotein-sorting protein
MRTNRFRQAAVLAVVTCGLGFSSPLGAAAANPARELLDRVSKLDDTERAWTDRTQHLRLTIVDRRGNERRRELLIRTKKFGEDVNRTILFFLSPPEVRGIGLLQWVRPRDEDRQWLFLPELKRVRRITGTSKRESFVGTDFSYEDLTIWTEVLDWTEEEARSRLLGEETVDGRACAVIELVPIDADVSYGKLRLWLARDDLVLRRMQFDDDHGRLVKTLDLSDVRPVKDIPVAHRLVMHNERGGGETRVTFTEVQFDTGVADDEFTQRRLEKGI